MQRDTMAILTMVDRELSGLPAGDKAGFMEARVLKPDTITLESSPATFYEFCLNNFTATAHLLATYWKQRRMIFGDKACLPLLAGSQTHFGEAVSTDDQAVLQSGFVQTLPPDASGRRVLFMNPSALQQSTCPLESLQRATFLALQSILQNLKQSTSQLVLLVLINDTFSTREVELLKWTCATVANAMPMTLSRLHLIKSSEHILPSLTFSTIDQIVCRGLADDVTFTNFRSPADLFSKLESFGMSPGTLPAALQGAYTWNPMALLGPAGSAVQNAAVARAAAYPGPVAAAAAAQMETSNQSSSEETESKPSSVQEALDCNDEPERKRSRNAVYSRRKYLRKKIELDVLKTESSRLKTENENLKKEHERLEELMQKAREQVRHHQHATSSTLADPGSTSRQQDPTVPEGSVSSSRSMPFSPALSAGQMLLSDHSALLALSRARLEEQVTSLPPSILMDPRAREQQRITEQQIPYLLSNTLNPGSHSGRLGTGITLPNLPESQQRLLPSMFPPSQNQALSHWISQVSGTGMGLSGGTSVRTQLTEEDLQRYLNGLGEEGKRGF